MDVHPPKNGINRYWSIPMYDSVCCTSMMFTIEHRLWHDAAADKYVYAVLHGRQAVSFLCPQVKVLWQELQLITAPGSFIVIEVFNMLTQIWLENTQKNQKRYMVSYLALRKSVIHLWIWGYFGAPHFLRSHIIWCTSFCLLDKGSTFWLSRARFCPAWEWRGGVTDNDRRSKRIYICILWPKSWNIGGNERPYTGLEIIMKSFYIDSPKIHPRWYRFAASEGWGRSPSCRMRKGSALRLHSIEKNVMLPGKSLEGVVWINMV
jgi:hypothetical protein